MNHVHIRRTRLEKGLTQVQLATAAGITQSTLSLIESGRSGASFQTAARLAAALGISVDSLVTNQDAPAPTGANTAIETARS